VALYFWPLSLPESSEDDLTGEVPLLCSFSLRLALALFALIATLRPSNVLFSLPLVILLLQRIMSYIDSAATALESTMAVFMIGKVSLVIGLTTAVSITFIDSVYFGRLTFTPLAFLKRNVFESISVFYGQAPIHFYLTSALPFVCFTTLPYTLYGFWVSFQTSQVGRFDRPTRRWLGIRGENDPIALKTLARVSFFFMAAMSFLGHKEVRFLQPLVPLLHIFEGYALSHLPSLQSIYRGLGQGEEEQQENTRQRMELDRANQVTLVRALSVHTSTRNRRHLLSPDPRLFSVGILSRVKQAFKEIYQRHGRVLLILLSAHILPIIYLSFHSMGQVAVVETTGRLSRQGHLNQIGFLMPCHSTPWMSHIHDKKLYEANNSWFISCEPPLDG